MRVLSIVHRREWADSRLLDFVHMRGETVEVVCPSEGDPLPSLDDVDAVMIGGGDVSVWRAGDHPWMQAEIDLARQCALSGTPYLGICLGAQILAAAFGSTSLAREDKACEFGFYPVVPTRAGRDLFDGVEAAYQAHFEGLDRLPPEAELLASTELFEFQAFSIGDHAYGVQFHPDVRVMHIEQWWNDNAHLQGQPNAHDLENQLADAERFEPSMNKLAGSLVDAWLGPR